MRHLLRMVYAVPLVVVMTVSASGQGRSRTVSAGDLERSAFELAGDSSAWPILIHYARRDAAKNTFVLDAPGLSSLRAFKTSHTKVRRTRADLGEHIGQGARIFAPAELKKANELMDRYAQAIRDEDPDGAVRLAAGLVEAVTLVGTAVKERRTEDIMAALASKEGTVDKRKGLLGRWNDARVDDSFAPTDAVRTGQESQAGLTFSDGVDVVVGERTTVVIRESRIDKLNQRVSRDVDLVTGSVLAKLTSAARDGGSLTMRAGPAESDVKSGRFWVEAAQRREMRLSNYDGNISVTANNVEVTLEKNQGTIAREGEPPMQPVALLPAPSLPWSSPDTVIGTDNIRITWPGVDGATSYVFETSTNREFEGTTDHRPLSDPSARLTGLPLGASYVRIAAVDKSGLRGIESPVHSVIRIEDHQPPAIILEIGEATMRVTARERFILKGTTEQGARLTANGTVVSVGSDGSFSFPVDVQAPLTRVTLEARDRANNLSTRVVSLQRPDGDKLRAISANAPIQGRTIRSQDGRLELRGIAYPGMTIEFKRGGTTQRVQTASDGRWFIAVDNIAAGAWTLSMELLSENIIVYSETYEIE